MNQERINGIIERGIDFLDWEQQENGSFLSLSSPDQTSFASVKKYSTTFSASLILNCLCSLKETPQIKRIKKRLVKFLLSQKSDHWSFNYWVRGSKQAEAMPYPDDLDDTFVALSALLRAQPELIDGSALAKIVMLLTSVEKQESGPYCTWIVPKSAEKVWQDVDLAVNSNVAYFLALQKVSLKKLNAFIEKAIDANNYFSPYYLSVHSVIYFISRFYQGSKINQVKNFLLSKQVKTGEWGNPLKTALAVSALLNFGIFPNQLGESIEYLMEARQKGIWKEAAFCLDPVVKAKKYYAGSKALTTAFCLEALAKYSQTNLSAENKSEKTGLSSGENFVYHQVIKKAQQRFNLLGEDLQKQFLKILALILNNKNGQEMILLAHSFRSALNQKGKDLSDDFMIKLGLASLLGWVSYTIYDDFLDEEGDPKMLSVANVCLREVNKIFAEILPEKSGFKLFAEKILDQIDSANIWEVSHCHSEGKKPLLKFNYRDYSKLAEKSFGHSLGPIAILFYLGYKEESPEIKNLIQFFRYYLIARQLNDDVHDWNEDLGKGQVNAVGALVLRKAKIKSLPLRRQRLNLEEVFWYEVSIVVFKQMEFFVRGAKWFLNDISVIEKPEVLEKLLVPIEFSIKKALQERKESIDFLRAFGDS